MANNIEKPIVVESPSTVNSEQLNVYVPVASTNKKGIAKYNSRYFTVDNGEVNIKGIPGQYISKIEYNNATNEIWYYWVDDTEETPTTSITKVPFPVVSSDENIKVIKYNAVISIDFTKKAWSEHDIGEVKHYTLLIEPDRFGAKDTKYLVFAEDKLDAISDPTDADDRHLENYWLNRYGKGYVTTEASYFKLDEDIKDEDNRVILKKGTLIYTIESEPYDGRLLILGGYLFDEKIVKVTYEENVFRVEYTDGGFKEYAFPFNEKADKYIISRGIAVGDNLAGVTVRFDSYYASVTFSSGARTIANGDYFYLSGNGVDETFWFYQDGWLIPNQTYTFPPGEGWTVTELNDYAEDYITMEFAVDCEYNYKTINGFTTTVEQLEGKVTTAVDNLKKDTKEKLADALKQVELTVDDKADIYYTEDVSTYENISIGVDLSGKTVRFKTLSTSSEPNWAGGSETPFVSFKNGSKIVTGSWVSSGPPKPDIGIEYSEGYGPSDSECLWGWQPSDGTDAGWRNPTYTFPSTEGWIVTEVNIVAGLDLSDYIEYPKETKIDCEYNYTTKADLSIISVPAEQSYDLSGHHIRFDNSINLSPYQSQYAYGKIMLKSSGGYTFGCRDEPQIALWKGTPAYGQADDATIIKTFWTYKGWEADANKPYKLPDDFGTITEIDRSIPYSISELIRAELRVDPEYNYKSIEKLKPGYKMYYHKAMISTNNAAFDITFYSARSTPYTNICEMYLAEGEKLFTGVYRSGDQGHLLTLSVQSLDELAGTLTIFCLDVDNMSLLSIYASLSSDNVTLFE